MPGGIGTEVMGAGSGGSLLQTQFSPEPNGLHNSTQTQKSKLCFIEERRRTECYGLWVFEASPGSLLGTVWGILPHVAAAPAAHPSGPNAATLKSCDLGNAGSLSS